MTNDWSALAAVAAGVLAQHGGAAKTAHFLAGGISALQIGGLLRRGFLYRPRSGWYLDPESAWQAKHAVRVGGVLTCVSLCDLLGIPVPSDARSTLHVLLPANAPRVRHHRDRRHYVVPGEDLQVSRHWSRTAGTPTGWRAPLVDALVELAECVPLDWWIAALDAALHRPREGGEPLLSDEELLRLRGLLPKALRPALDLVDPLSESCLETLLRLGMRRRGIGPVVPQFRPDPAGVRLFEADFRVGTRLLVEADGQAYHDPERDAIRDAYLRSLGYVVLRFRYDEIVGNLEGVLDRIEAALAALAA